MEKLPIFDPTAQVRVQALSFAPRPKSLRGVRIGLVENTKFNSDKLLLKIAAILEKKQGAKSHIIRSKSNAGVPVNQQIIDEFVENCDVVISGIGD
jgi:hypothetical protein